MFNFNYFESKDRLNCNGSEFTYNTPDFYSSKYNSIIPMYAIRSHHFGNNSNSTYVNNRNDLNGDLNCMVLSSFNACSYSNNLESWFTYRKNYKTIGLASPLKNVLEYFYGGMSSIKIALKNSTKFIGATFGLIFIGDKEDANFFIPIAILGVKKEYLFILPTPDGMTPGYRVKFIPDSHEVTVDNIRDHCSVYVNEIIYQKPELKSLLKYVKEMMSDLSDFMQVFILTEEKIDKIMFNKNSIENFSTIKELNNFKNAVEMLWVEEAPTEL